MVLQGIELTSRFLCFREVVTNRQATEFNDKETHDKDPGDAGPASRNQSIYRLNAT